LLEVCVFCEEDIGRLANGRHDLSDLRVESRVYTIGICFIGRDRRVNVDSGHAGNSRRSSFGALEILEDSLKGSGESRTSDAQQEYRITSDCRHVRSRLRLAGLEKACAVAKQSSDLAQESARIGAEWVKASELELLVQVLEMVTCDPIVPLEYGSVELRSSVRIHYTEFHGAGVEREFDSLQ
jgi:hypothetical protein